MLTEAIILARMQAYIQPWEEAANSQAVFLKCYKMMTGNMLQAIDNKEFADGPWVDRLLHRFADYYFEALDIYGRDAQAAPAVWQLAHDWTRKPGALPVQNLLLGVNAHINYDLVLTLVDLLEPEWPRLDDAGRNRRHGDYIHVNEVIAQTIDRVQDEILEPLMPGTDLMDRLLGPLDERLISSLINRWRESVWRHACTLLEASTLEDRIPILGRVESDALRWGRLICVRPLRAQSGQREEKP